MTLIKNIVFISLLMSLLSFAEINKQNIRGTVSGPFIQGEQREYKLWEAFTFWHFS